MKWQKKDKTLKEKFDTWIREHIRPWHCKYRIIRYKYYRYSVQRIETVYLLEGRVFFTLYWFFIDSFSEFGKAYRQMKELRGVPKSSRHTYTEDECVLELLGEMEDD